MLALVLVSAVNVSEGARQEGEFPVELRLFVHRRRRPVESNFRN